MASIKLKKQKKTDEDSQADEDAKSESQSRASDIPKRRAVRPKQPVQDGSKESSEVLQPPPNAFAKKPLPTKTASQNPQQPEAVAVSHGQDYEADREYLRFFEKEMYPLLQRIKQDLLASKPKDILASCIEWVEKEKRGEHRGKPSRHRDAEADPEPRDSAPDATSKPSGKPGARDKTKK